MVAVGVLWLLKDLIYPLPNEWIFTWFQPSHFRHVSYSIVIMVWILPLAWLSFLCNKSPFLWCQPWLSQVSTKRLKKLSSQFLDYFSTRSTDGWMQWSIWWWKVQTFYWVCWAAIKVPQWFISTFNEFGGAICDIQIILLAIRVVLLISVVRKQMDKTTVMGLSPA